MLMVETKTVREPVESINMDLVASIAPYTKDGENHTRIVLSNSSIYTVCVPYIEFTARLDELLRNDEKGIIKI